MTFMRDILSCCAVLPSFNLSFVVKGPSGDMQCTLAKVINVMVLRICLYLTLVPVQINNKEEKL